MRTYSSLPPTAATLTAALTAGAPGLRAEQVSGNQPKGRVTSMAASAQVFGKRKGSEAAQPSHDRQQIAQPWQIECYRQVRICGPARYAAVLFSALAGRAEIGVSEPQTLAKKAIWVNTGPEVDAFAEVAPTVRERSALVRTFMLHWVIAGECYLIARERLPHDPGYVEAPINPETNKRWDWDAYLAHTNGVHDVLDPDFDVADLERNPNIDNPVWEIVAVTELRKVGPTDETSNGYQVQVAEGNWIGLRTDDPVIRMWNPDPVERDEAWSTFRGLLPTLKEIEYYTKHIFVQVRSRLMAAGVWFIPDNITFPAPPASAGLDAETISAMNEAEQFMVSLAASSMETLADDEVAYPTVVMADAAALAMVDQGKLIKFWSELDDKAMVMRADSIRQFALGMDLPPEQVLGSSGLAVTDSGGSAGSVNHWGVWANEEQTISAHIEPALDAFVGIMTIGMLRLAVPKTTLIIAYDTASLRLRQDRSVQALELHARGVLKASVVLRECGFDPDNDAMDDTERVQWVLMKMVSGSWAPEQANVAAQLLGVSMPDMVSGNQGQKARPEGTDGRAQPGNVDGIEVKGPPTEQHDHSPAPFSAQTASAEAVVLRALEKAGNRLLNDGKRGRDKDRETSLTAAHTVATLDRTYSYADFDTNMVFDVFPDLEPTKVVNMGVHLGRYCAMLYNEGARYTRTGLTEHMKGI